MHEWNKEKKKEIKKEKSPEYLILFHVEEILFFHVEDFGSVDSEDRQLDHAEPALG